MTPTGPRRSTVLHEASALVVLAALAWFAQQALLLLGLNALGTA